MRARFLLMGYAVLVAPALAMPITYYEPGYGNAGPLILTSEPLLGSEGNVPRAIRKWTDRGAKDADTPRPGLARIFKPRLVGSTAGRPNDFSEVSFMGGLGVSQSPLRSLPNQTMLGDAGVHEDNLPPSVTPVHFGLAPLSIAKHGHGE